jgi:hypothetical protein
MLDTIHADRFAEARARVADFALFEAFCAHHGLTIEPFSGGDAEATITTGKLTGRFYLTKSGFWINLYYKDVIVDFSMIDHDPANGVVFDQAFYNDLSTKLETGYWTKIGKALENLTAAEADATPDADRRLQQAFQMATNQPILAPKEFLAFCRSQPAEKVARLVYEKLPFPITAIAVGSAAHLAWRSNEFHQLAMTHAFTSDENDCGARYDEELNLAATLPGVPTIESNVQSWRELAMFAQIIADRMTTYANCFPETIKIEGTTAYVEWGT